MDQTLRLLAKFNQEFLYIAVSVLFIILALIIVYWAYYRRKLHELSHQIPASVVKNYLDSIIANSNALKSSLFRGGGLDIGQGIPSVLPTSSLPTGGIATSDGMAEELALKNAEISNLRAQNLQRDKTIVELEAMLANAKDSGGSDDNGEKVLELQNEIQQLKSQLANAAAKPAGAGGDAALQAELAQVSKERDEYKERLMEYEIIEEDLANLKRFQQENATLKKTIEELKAGGASVSSAAEKNQEEEPPEEVTGDENPNADDSATQAASEEMPDVPNNEGEQKSAEELLNEFEKMLG